MLWPWRADGFIAERRKGTKPPSLGASTLIPDPAEAAPAGSSEAAARAALIYERSRRRRLPRSGVRRAAPPRRPRSCESTRSARTAAATARSLLESDSQEKESTNGIITGRQGKVEALN